MPAAEAFNLILKTGAVGTVRRAGCSLHSDWISRNIFRNS
jgi:hypothetical protein